VLQTPESEIEDKKNIHSKHNPESLSFAYHLLFDQKVTQ